MFSRIRFLPYLGFFALALACVRVGAAQAPAAAPAFRAARAVWPAGWRDEMNKSAAFTATFAFKKGEEPVLRLAGANAYRVYVNGVFAHYGPARAPKGFARVDELPLAPLAVVGANTVRIEVAAYRVNSYYHLDLPGFLRAEIVSGDKVLAATPEGFTADGMPRVQKVCRYSFQRPFTEIWRLPDVRRESLALEQSVYGESVKLLPRRAPMPDFSVRGPFKAVEKLTHAFDAAAPVRRNRFEQGVGEGSKLRGFRTADLEENTYFEIQRLRVTGRNAKPETDKPGCWPMAAGEGFLFDAGAVDSGFIKMQVAVAQAPARVMVSFDEVRGADGLVDPLRYDCDNTVTWEFSRPGVYEVQSFEPYTFRWLHAFATAGAVTLASPSLVGYRNPVKGNVSYAGNDPVLAEVFAAARSTFAQNAVDVFTDCPGRERAGWLCDSFFIGRTSELFTGSTDMETLFLENFALPEKFEHIPEGMLPMCFPADHDDNGFIPNWAMWFVLELDEYARVRHGDPALVKALEPRVDALVKFFEHFRNTDGLLEKLPGWVFVEWSKANNYTQDVNYPSNMTYAEMLDAVNRLYGRPDLARRASEIRETVRKQSFDGTWFRDHAKRGEDGRLVVQEHRSETCQYYAFYFHTASPETHPDLWKKLADDFGPGHKGTAKYPNVDPANAFIGNYLRLELLSRAGLKDKILAETAGYFKYMADRTGTLWEHDSTSASCCHGFASHAAVLILRDVCGMKIVPPDVK